MPNINLVNGFDKVDIQLEKVGGHMVQYRGVPREQARIIYNQLEAIEQKAKRLKEFASDPRNQV